jgi:hypothetical protein
MVYKDQNGKALEDAAMSGPEHFMACVRASDTTWPAGEWWLKRGGVEAQLLHRADDGIDVEFNVELHINLC